MENLVLTQKQLASIKTNLIDGMSLAAGARSSATYYHSKDEQDSAIRNAVSKLYKQSKELPLILANQKGATGKFIQEVLANEFKNTSMGGSCNIINPIDWYDNGLSDKAILNALYNLNENGIPYVLRLFTDLKKQHVNNERMRKIALGFIWGHPNIEFNALKYRNKLAKILKHIYGERRTSILLSIAEKTVRTHVFQNAREHEIYNDLVGRFDGGFNQDRALKLLLFIFKYGESYMYNETEFSLISQYFKAKDDVTSVSKVPEEVLIGLISDKKHPQYQSMWSTKIKREATKATFRKNVTVTSVNQQVRQTKSTAKLGVEKTVDVSKATDYMALYKTGYENGFTPELNSAIKSLAEAKKIKDFPYNSIGIVIDNSASMGGHKQQSKNTPKAIADFTSKVLGVSAEHVTFVKTMNDTTDLATAFVDLMKREHKNKPYDAVFFITDGYENMYEGLTNEVVNMYMTESGRYFPIFQISPVLGAEMEANIRPLGTEIVKLAINSPTALMPQINARLLEVDTKKWLENQVKLLDQSTVSRYAKNNVHV